MKQNKGIKIAYTAGVIDSDGCIAIKKTNITNYALTILLNSPDGRVIDFLKGVWGGSVYEYTPNTFKKNGEKSSVVYRWELKGKNASVLCKKMIPFLRTKKHQAEMAVQFYTHKENGMECGKNGVKFRRKPLTDYEISFRENLYQEMKKIKKIFVKPCAAVETK